MMKKVMAVLFIAGVLFACTTESKKENNESTGTEITAIAVNDFDAKAGDFVGKTVKVEGTVDHVCKHGGKRMFIFDDNPDVRVKITPDESLASFDATVEQKDVVVEGIVEELRIDDQYLNEWEAEAKAQMAEAEAAAEENAEEVTEELAEEANEGGDGVGEHKGDHSDHNAHAGGKGEDADMGRHIAAQTQIDDYRKQIAESEKGYLSFYSIKCTKYSVKED